MTVQGGTRRPELTERTGKDLPLERERGGRGLKAGSKRERSGGWNSEVIQDWDHWNGYTVISLGFILYERSCLGGCLLVLLI